MWQLDKFTNRWQRLARPLSTGPRWRAEADAWALEPSPGHPKLQLVGLGGIEGKQAVLAASDRKLHLFFPDEGVSCRHSIDNAYTRRCTFGMSRSMGCCAVQPAGSLCGATRRAYRWHWTHLVRPLRWRASVAVGRGVRNDALRQRTGLIGSPTRGRVFALGTSTDAHGAIATSIWSLTLKDAYSLG